MIEPKNILIVRTDRIGDVVLSLPLATIIKKHFPNSKVAFLLREYTKPLAKDYSDIDEVIVLNAGSGKLKVFENLPQLKNKFDVCIVAFPTFKIALILFLSRIKTRIGTGYRWYSFLFNKKIYEHRKFGERHELEYNVMLLKHLGIDENISEENVSFKLHPGDKSRQFIKSELENLGIDLHKKIIIIHPGSGGSAIDLPFDKMKSLIELMAHELDCEILITGSSSEKELCDSLIVNEKTKSLAGKFDLDGLMALIERSVLLIANSTGPIHIAAALGRYVIGFYPKIAACSPKRWGPYTKRKIIFSPALSCGNCTREQCEKLNCMETIDVNEVFSAVKNALENGADK
jgi:heptosyltransferase III